MKEIIGRTLSLFITAIVLFNILVFAEVREEQKSELVTNSITITNKIENTTTNNSVKEEKIMLEATLLCEGGNESTGDLPEEYLNNYDTNSYGYKIGDKRLFKIIESGEKLNFQNALYCLNGDKPFPETTALEYKKVADLKDKDDLNVKKLELNGMDYGSLIWLINNIYLRHQTPELKDSFLAKAFNVEIGSDDFYKIKSTLTDDDIEVVQQWAIWNFTNSETEKYTSFGAVTLNDYINNNEGSFEDVTGSQEREKYVRDLYNYLISKAYTYSHTISASRPCKVTIEDEYYKIGPFYVSEGKDSKLVDSNDIEIPEEKYKIKIEGEDVFTTEKINQIFNKNYYIYIPIKENDLTKIKLNVSYLEYETNATLLESVEENYQPVVLITRSNVQKEYFKEAEIIKENNFNVSLVSDKNELEIGENLEVTAKIENIENIEKGVMALTAKLEYDTNLLELQDISEIEGWDSTVYNEKNGKMVTLRRSDFATQDTEVFKFIFRVKDNKTTDTNTILYLKDIISSNAVIEINAEDVNLGIKILGSSSTESKAYIVSEKYLVENNENMISKISPKTKVKDFIDNVITNKDLTIVDRDEKEVSEDSNLGTGMIVKVGRTLEYTIVVTGDSDGNGEITGTDLAQMKLHFIDKEQLIGASLKAIDINYDGRITVTDLALVKLIITELITI